jgi:pyridoxal phosphate enzyme (YggS family)
VSAGDLPTERRPPLALDEGRLAENLAALQARIAAAARSAGRDAGSVRLVAVSKTHPAEVVAAAARAGQLDFGENRVEEALPKMAALAGVAGVAGVARLRWHMIGHVQSRKARDAIAGGFALVHSVDSVKLAERLSRMAQEAGRWQAVLLECNVSGEASKSGFPAQGPADWEALLHDFERVAALPGLEVRGLMTMAPMAASAESARLYFERLRRLKELAAARVATAAWSELSMGMTDDFEAAIAEGATLVRVGRAIFGERA